MTGRIHASGTDWDASAYHQVSDPQFGWGRRVLERLQPKDGEHILDVGCGTGRLTSAVAAAAPQGRIVGMDPSRTMLAEAHGRFGHVSAFVQGDGTRVPFADAVFDAVFSTATFHWIKDHESLFREIHRVLKHGGRLVAQCGGGPNLQQLYLRARELRNTGPYAPYFIQWTEPFNFESPVETRARLEGIGFVEVGISLEPAQTPFPDIDAYAAFVTTVCLRHHLERLPAGLRQRFVSELSEAAAADDPPLTLDYWRLNIDARRD